MLCIFCSYTSIKLSFTVQLSLKRTVRFRRTVVSTLVSCILHFYFLTHKTNLQKSFEIIERTRSGEQELAILICEQESCISIFREPDFQRDLSVLGPNCPGPKCPDVIVPNPYNYSWTFKLFSFVSPI